MEGGGGVLGVADHVPSQAGAGHRRRDEAGTCGGDVGGQLHRTIPLEAALQKSFGQKLRGLFGFGS